MEYLPLIIAIAAILNLIILSWIDLKSWILPDKLNLLLGILGIAFHASLNFSVIDPMGMLFGALVGGGILYAVRFAGNWYYKQDTLGLGDVKLLAAAGIWLGATDIIMALTVGAFAGLLHGIFVALTTAIREKTKPNMRRLMIPAGPGFCIGIAVIGAWKFMDVI